MGGIKFYLIGDLTSDSEDEKQMLRAHREAATSNKKNERILSKKDKRFGIPPSSTTENLLNLSVDHRQTQLVAFGTIFTQGYQQGSKVCFSYVKKNIFSAVAPSKEISIQNVNRQGLGILKKLWRTYSERDRLG